MTTEEVGYKLDGNVLSFKEHELTKTKEGVGSKLKKEHKKDQPSSISDTDLEVLIGTYVYTYISTNSLSINGTQILSALLELKRLRQSA